MRRKVFTGFRKFNIQAVMNNLAWGLDHTIYGAASGNGGAGPPGGAARGEAGPRPPQGLPLRSRHSGRFEAISGGARFGNTFDDWGNRFLCNIRNPAEHVVLPARYLARNPYLPPPRVLHDAAEAGDQIPIYPHQPARALARAPGPPLGEHRQGHARAASWSPRGCSPRPAA